MVSLSQHKVNNDEDMPNVSTNEYSRSNNQCFDLNCSFSSSCNNDSCGELDSSSSSEPINDSVLVSNDENYISDINSCESITGKFSDSSNKENDFLDSQFRKSLKHWLLTHGCTRQFVNDLLALLFEKGHSLPKDSRTMLGTKNKNDIAVVADKTYVYFGIKNNIERILNLHKYQSQDIRLNVDIDGPPI